MRPTLFLATLATVLAAGVSWLAPYGAIAQQDYTGRGFAVYAPRPVGPTSATAQHPPAPPAADNPLQAGPKAEAIRRSAQAALDLQLPRRLTVRNVNTGQQLSVVYWVDGAYDAWELARLSQLLHDHHRNATVAIDWRLVDLMWLVARMTGGETVHVHSGYRTRQTNASLAAATTGVAHDSQHVAGKALDISLPGVSPRTVAGLAAAMGWGGVGFYGDAGHVHIDVGPVRVWGK
ncbi:MAG: DUF882 domain-containing protein [Enhydrobacter sp.]|nr:DUF882 domain-containing protein [Enhydrobacter sp.]